MIALIIQSLLTVLGYVITVFTKITNLQKKDPPKTKSPRQLEKYHLGERKRKFNLRFLIFVCVAGTISGICLQLYNYNKAEDAKDEHLKEMGEQQRKFQQLNQQLENLQHQNAEAKMQDSIHHLTLMNNLYKIGIRIDTVAKDSFRMRNIYNKNFTFTLTNSHNNSFKNFHIY